MVTGSLTLASCVQAVGWSYDPLVAAPQGWSLLSRATEGPAQAVIAAGQGFRALLLPGTNELADWFLPVPEHVSQADLLNLDNLVIDRNGCAVQRGAARHADAVTTWGGGVLKACDIIIGHSLGGASALLLGRDLDLPVLAVAPYSPYHRRAPFVRALSVVNPADIVPSYPPGEWVRPGSDLLVPATRGGPVHAHRVATYLEQLRRRGRRDLAPMIEASR